MRFFCLFLLRCGLLSALLWPAWESLWAQALRPTLRPAGPQTGLNVPADLLVTPDRSVDFIVALVNNEPITNHDVRMTTQRLKEQLTQSGQRFDEVGLLNEALELLIFERSQLQWAKELKVNISDDELNGMADSVAARNQLSLDEFYRALERQGVSKAVFLKNLRERQILQRLRDREVQGRIRITDPEIERFLQQQKASLPQQAQIELAQILIPLSESASAEQVAQAERQARDWRAEIERGADFFAVAQQRSQSLDRAQGGRMGLRPADRYPELFIQATKDVAEGGMTGPIRSGAGWHLLRVVERRSAMGLTMPQTHARHILLKSSPSLSPAAARNQLLVYKQQIDRGQVSFEQMARLHSQDGSAAQGGDLGWATPGQFVPEFEQVMNELRPGQVSEPLTSRFGVHLIQVIERREVPLTGAQEREYARSMLRESKFDEALDTWAREVRGQAYIEYREPPQ